MPRAQDAQERRDTGCTDDWPQTTAWMESVESSLEQRPRAAQSLSWNVVVQESQSRGQESVATVFTACPCSDHTNVRELGTPV